MRGAVSIIIQVIFGLGLGMIIVTLLLTRMGVPTMAVYSQENANITAQMLASSLNALSNIESGRIEQELNGSWDITVYEEEGQIYVDVAHFDKETGKLYKARRRVLGNVTPTTVTSPETGGELYYVTSIALEKKPGKAVVVSKII